MIVSHDRIIGHIKKYVKLLIFNLLIKEFKYINEHIIIVQLIEPNLYI